MDISIDKELKQKDLIYKKAKAKNKDYTINDGNGLFMKITKDNKKLWHFRFTFNKKRFLTSFRSYPKVSLATARSKRNKYLSLLNQGINPIEYFRKEKENLEVDKKGMFENVFNEWLIYESKKLAPPTFKTKKQIFISSVLPYLKNKHIKNITKNDLLKIIENKRKNSKRDCFKTNRLSYRFMELCNK
ncbi:integrase [Aliarcobacter butzleri JV22]|uniref:tyrosine-type recombinase/integrase n=1 Tax=Aliarcobacter butzleri TaxID=28197 RepID=UPI0001F11E44|nr:integrase arm-type DNA-binding domain-containing protein [Aliarcobacter butzleri]EFU68762.1 integrase [Aliarcobacter butzleri JV22]